MTVPTWLWLVTIGGLAAVILLDLLVVGRRPHAVTIGGQSADGDEPQPGGHGHGRSSEGTWARREAGPRSLPSTLADR